MLTDHNGYVKLNENISNTINLIQDIEMSSKEQLDKMLRLAQPLVSDKTSLVIFPETALANGIWKIDLLNDYEVNTIRKFVEPFPNLNYLTGLTFLVIDELDTLLDADNAKSK